MLKFKFNFNYCKSILKFLIYCYGQKILLFNYNIQNNLTTTTIIMIEREAEAETYSRRGLQGEKSETEPAGLGFVYWVGNRWRVLVGCGRRGGGGHVVIVMVQVVMPVGCVITCCGGGCRCHCCYHGAGCCGSSGGCGGCGGCGCQHCDCCCVIVIIVTCGGGDGGGGH